MADNQPNSQPAPQPIQPEGTDDASLYPLLVQALGTDTSASDAFAEKNLPNQQHPTNTTRNYSDNTPAPDVKSDATTPTVLPEAHVNVAPPPKHGVRPDWSSAAGQPYAGGVKGAGQHAADNLSQGTPMLDDKGNVVGYNHTTPWANALTAFLGGMGEYGRATADMKYKPRGGAAIAEGAGIGAESELARQQQQETVAQNRKTTAATIAHYNAQTLVALADVDKEQTENQQSILTPFKPLESTLEESNIAPSMKGVTMDDIHKQYGIDVTPGQPVKYNGLTGSIIAVPVGFTPLTDDKGQHQPGTGYRTLFNVYSNLDPNKPVTPTADDIAFWQKAGIPQAATLDPSKPMPAMPLQSYLSMNVQARSKWQDLNTTPANWELKNGVNPQTNQPEMMAVNKATGQSRFLGVSPEAKLDKADIVDPASGKTYTWIVDETTGKKLHNLGEAGSTQGNNSAPNGDFSKTGDSYIATLPQADQSLVKAVGTYRMQPSAMGGAMGGRRMAIMAEVAQAYGDSFDEKQYPIRYETQKEYTIGGTGQNLVRFNTVTQHLAMLDQAAQAMKNGDLQPLNNLKQTLAKEFGGTAPTTYAAVVNAVNGELAGVYKGGRAGATDQEIGAVSETFTKAMAPDQAHDAIVATLGLVNGRINALNTPYQTTMGKTLDQAGFISPESKQVYQQFGVPLGAAFGQTTNSNFNWNNFPVAKPGG